MAANAAALEFQARRKNLLNLALKRDPILPRLKQGVSFVHDGEPPEAHSAVDESPPADSHINTISQSHMPVDESANTTKISSNKDSTTTTSSTLKIKSTTISTKSPIPAKAATSFSIPPIIPLVGVTILLLVCGAAAIFLPTFLLSLQHDDYSCLPGCWNG
ncbi:unnamed protein product, partial [Rotaria magnacalcarata]